MNGKILIFIYSTYWYFYPVKNLLTSTTELKFLLKMLTIASQENTWIVKVIGAQHSVWPYPSIIKQPNVHLAKVRIFPASGAEPTTIKRNLPPMSSWIFLKTNLSQIVFLLIMLFLISVSFALSPILKSCRFRRDCSRVDCTYNYNIKHWMIKNSECNNLQYLCIIFTLCRVRSGTRRTGVSKIA